MKPKLFSLCLAIMVFTFCSCQSQTDKTKSEEDPDVLVCQNFIENLSQGKEDKLKPYFDDIVLKAASDSALSSALHDVYTYFKKAFPDQITTKFAIKELTRRENLPSTFVLLKIETESQFGYYNFYVNSATHKIILVQIAVQPTPKL